MSLVPILESPILDRVSPKKPGSRKDSGTQRREKPGAYERGFHEDLLLLRGAPGKYEGLTLGFGKR